MNPISLPAVAANEYLTFATQLAAAAAAVTLPLFRQPLPVEVKSDLSPFTTADCNSEKAMCALINAHYPQHGIIGEEFGSNKVDAEFVWVLDPIDGTRSFISGSRQYSSLIGLLYRGVPVIGVMDFPALAECWTGIYTAEQRTAQFNNTPCCTSKNAPTLAQAIAATTTVAVERRNEDTQLQNFLPACGQVRLGGDAYAYAGVASGFSHLALDYLMQPYDYLPLLPIVYAAGGVMTDWQGAPLAPFTADGWKTAVASANDPLHQQAIAALASACPS
ncbi:MAG: histidinol phosphate phosphatase [Proteobacteria bacterium]|nr:histidinol phosphate phosphatase [Pseudomonadota bacterium]